MDEIFSFLTSSPLKLEVSPTNQLYRAVQVHHKKRLTVPPHYHSELEVVIPSNMTGKAYIGQKTYPIEQNSFFLVRPNEVHSYRYEPGNSDAAIVVLQFDPVALLAGIKSLTELRLSERIANLSVNVRDNAESIRTAIFELSTLHKEGSGPVEAAPESLLKDTGILFRILHQLVSGRKEHSVPKHDDRLKRIIDFIQTSLSKEFDLDDIARESCLSKAYLCRYFKAKTGLTLQTYINRSRIDLAQRNMLEKGMNVTEAAQASGFSSSSYFIQVFTKHMKISPKKWVFTRAG